MPLHKYYTIYYIFQSLLHKIMLTLRCAIQHDVIFIIFFYSISLLNPTFLLLNGQPLQDSILFHLGAKCMMIVHSTLYAVSTNKVYIKKKKFLYVNIMLLNIYINIHIYTYIQSVLHST